MPAEGTAGPGLIIAAPASGSGKTVVTLALLRALRSAGLRVASAKAGPDYIDPAFHAAATGRACFNLDCWAMRPATLARLTNALGTDSELVVTEGVMGLFDGINMADRQDVGSTADLAAATGWPVVLVIDAARQAASAGALVAGFARHRADVPVAGVIFNRVASDTHHTVLRAAVARAVPDIALLGAVPRDAGLQLPERHLGLVQAGEHDRLESFLDHAAAVIAQSVDLDLLRRLARQAQMSGVHNATPPLPPLGQRIAVARDAAFAFAYDDVLAGWRDAGAEIVPFSPLADEAPDSDADAIYLPGGYPELHGGVLATAQVFQAGLRDAAARGAAIFGECGGYMILGHGLTDADGTRHAMAGLLPLETSFANRRLHLGYREAELCAAGPLGPAGTRFRGHEFHYATITSEAPDAPLFTAQTAAGMDLGPAGCASGRIAGSFIHLIDRAPEAAA